MGDEVRERIRRAVEDARAEQVEFLADLIRHPSENPPGDCAPHADLAAGLLEALGFRVERHPVADELARGRGMVSAVNLIVRERFGDGPTIALNANGDAVRPGEGWTVDPYGATIRDGAIYGRGAAWAKSDFATFAFALRALKAARAPLKGTVELHFTYDEEVGGEIGPKWILERGLSRPDLAIVSAFSYAVLTAHNGCLHLEVQVRGRSAHAMAPETGVDALEAATRVLAALYRHRAGYRERRSAVPGIESPTLVVGLIEGGINTNVVPDLITFRIDRRIIPEEDAGEAEATLARVITDAAAGFAGIGCTIRRTMLARPLVARPGVERVVEAIRRNARRELGVEVPAQGMPIYTDARHYHEAGVPTVLYGAGPKSLIEAGVHRADEHVRLDDLRRATHVVAATLLDLLG